MSANRNIVIFGAGPAGLSAALWLRNLGFVPLVVEAEACPGGLQNLNFLTNDWVLGQTGQTGPMLAARFVDHAQSAGIALRIGVRPVAVAGGAGDFQVVLDDGTQITCAAILVATGTRYRADEVLADVAGIEGVPPGRIVYGPYAFADLASLAGRRVLIVGGGDNAFENVRLLAPTAIMVHLVVRGRPRAQRTLAEAVALEVARGRCRLCSETHVTAVKELANSLRVVLHGSFGSEEVVVDRMHVLAGYEPNTAFLDRVFADGLATALACDGQGYLLADADGRSRCAGIYAAGDVCNPVFPSVVSAVADGARAAKTIEMDLRAK
jgi:thioredoxin reductase